MEEPIQGGAGGRETEGAPGGAVTKGERPLEGSDDRILSLNARGMTVREIRGHLEEHYGVAVSSDLMSRVTDTVLGEVREWQNRPLDPVYPVVFFDARRVKIRDEGLVRDKAVYLALAINSEGDKDVLGLWIEQTEGAKFWLKMMNELQDPRPAGYPHRGGGRAQGLSLLHRHGVPAHRGPEYILTPPPSCAKSQDHLNYRHPLPVMPTYV